MSVLEFEAPEEKVDKPEPVCPSKIIVLALARDHRGIRAKMLAEIGLNGDVFSLQTLHRRFPDDYHKPLIKFFHDIGWRDTLKRLRQASKKWDYVAPVIVFVNKKLIGDDDDFNLFIRQKHFLMADPKKIVAFKSMSLLDKLQMDPLKTYVYFDISIDYRPCGRMIFQIEGDTMPESTKDFLRLCCSQKIPLPPGQYKRSKFAGSLIKRIVKEGWVRMDCIDDQRVYARGKYEKPALTHDRRGTLSMNNGPRGWLSSHVVITLDQHPWMDKLYRAIGILIDGEHVLHMLENVKTTYENPDIDVIITDNGILHSPNLMTTEAFLNPEMREAAERLKAFKDEYKSVLAAYVNAKPCSDPVVKAEPKDEEGEEDKPESNQGELIEEGLEPLSGIGVPSSHASLLASKSRIADFTATQSKVAVWGSDRAFGKNLPSFREISSKRSIPSFGSSQMIGTDSQTASASDRESLKKGPADSTMIDKPSSSGQGLTVKTSSKTYKDPATSAESLRSVQGEYEAEEVGEESEIKPELSEPDIQYTYAVPKGMADIRVGYKTFPDGGKRPEQYQKVGMKLPRNAEFEGTGQRETVKSLAKQTFSYEEPHQWIQKDGKLEYYEISKKAMAQVTPELLLAWAQGIDDDVELVDIEKAVNELLETAIKGSPSEMDLEGHPLDAVSMEDTRERFCKCLLSLPTQLLQMLHQAMQEIFERQDDGTEPLVVTGDSTSEVKLVVPKKQKAASEDVISGVMFSLIDFTKRMIESSTELVPNMKNLDYVTSLIDDVILQKVYTFLEKKKKKDARFHKKLPYNQFFTPGDPKVPYMKDLRKTKSGIGYYLDANLLPENLADVSAASLPHYSDVSAKRLPVHVKDPPKKSPSSA